MKKLLFSLVAFVFGLSLVIQIKTFELLWDLNLGMMPLSETELLIVFYTTSLIVIIILVWFKEIWKLRS